MAIDGVSQAKLNALATKLLESDADKVITNEEIKAFVEENEDELSALGIDTDTAVDEFKDILKDSLDDDAKVGAKAETEEAEGTEEDGTKAAELKALEAELDLLKKDLEALEGEKTALETKKTNIEADIKAETENYQALEAEIAKENENYEEFIKKLNEATKDMEEAAAQESKHQVSVALQEYDPEVDGEWDSYIEKFMADKEVDPSFTAAVKKFTNKIDFTAQNLSDLGTKLTTAGNKLNSLHADLKKVNLDIETKTDQIATKNEEISAKEAEIKKVKTAALKGTPGATADIDTVWECVPDGEKALAEEMGLDLTEKLPDGNPRFIFAKGMSVDEGAVYHIYDMANWNENGDNSLVRLKYGYDETSLSMIPIGNGGITPGTFNYTEGEGGTEIFYMDECDKIMSNCACYQTWSPLSLDINGDGVKTSDKKVRFDIDGDGVVDTINDSADAVLVFDKDKNGIAGEDGSEAFGNSTDLDGDGKADGYKDGFEALKALAQKEGLIDGKDDNTLDEKDLKILEEKWGLGIKKGGYTDSASSLVDAGITEINLAKTDKTELKDNFDGNGNQLMTQSGATFKINGETREYADIWHKKHDSGADTDESPFADALSLNFEEVNSEIRRNIAIGEDAKLESAASEKESQKMFDSNLFLGIGDDKYDDFKAEEAKKEEQEQEAKLKEKEEK